MKYFQFIISKKKKRERPSKDPKEAEMRLFGKLNN